MLRAAPPRLKVIWSDNARLYCGLSVYSPARTGITKRMLTATLITVIVSTIMIIVHFETLKLRLPFFPNPSQASPCATPDLDVKETTMCRTNLVVTLSVLITGSFASFNTPASAATTKPLSASGRYDLNYANV